MHIDKYNIIYNIRETWYNIDIFSKNPMLKNHYDCQQRFYFLSMTHWIINRTHSIAVVFGVHFNFVIRIIIIYCFNVVKQLNFSTTISLFNLDAKNKGF